MTDTVSTPSRRLTLTIDEKPVELFMSFGLLDNVIKKFNGEDGSVETALLQDATRRELVEFMLQKRGKYGWQDETPINLDESEISPDQIAKIAKFVLENVTDFFFKGAELSVEVLSQYAEKTTSLEHSAPGSKV